MSRETAPLVVRKGKDKLYPVDGITSAAIVADPVGQEYTLTRRRGKRSHPRLNTYWKALDTARLATGLWPTKEILHEAIKFDLGYVTPIRTMKGEVRQVPVSIAFDKMTEPEFNEYFGQAMALLAGTIGYDPLGFLEEEA